MRVGVQQWSVLGSFMFLLYTADIEKLMAYRGLPPYLYSDDTHMFISCCPRNTHLLRDTTLSCISNIEEWMYSNRLQLNPAKTEFLWCTTHRKLHLIDESPLTMKKPPFNQQSLDVLMDRDLSLRSHIARSMLQSDATSTRHQTFTDDGRFENAN